MCRKKYVRSRYIENKSQEQEIDNGDEKGSNILEQFREENQFNILIAKDILHYFSEDSMIF